MQFQHSDAIWRDFPALVAGVIAVEGIHPDADASEPVARYTAIARKRLDGATESELPEIQAWRRTFAAMGLKPTQYRCASEALLRRFRKEGALPSIHPLIDLCNAVSIAFAIPVAVFDVARVSGNLVVRHATGDERYLTFSGESEHPAEGEVIFADDDVQAHARRWTNRQSGRSAVRESTASVVVVAEAMHESADDDVARLVGALAADLASVWSVTPRTAVLTAASPRFGS